MKKRLTTTNAKAHLSFVDAAEYVLREESKPLKYSDLTAKAIKKGLVLSEAKNPETGMYVSLRSEINRRELRAEPQRFVFLGNGMFQLAELMAGDSGKKTKTATEQIKDSRRDASQELYRRLTDTDHGEQFEAMVGDLLIKMGYQNVQIIGGKDDQGVDILCEKRDGVVTTRFAFQCKCKSLKNKIGPKDISTLRDNLSTYQCQRGILVTTSQLNEEAKTKAKEAGKEPIQFIEHEEILDLFTENGIGIRTESLRHYQLDATQYDFLKPDKTTVKKNDSGQP
jgi:restriction endonuclease Mrr